MAKIERVLISVSDKSGIVDFAKKLGEFDVDFLSTGGTAAVLRESGLKITDVSDYTGFPEMLDGRIKTLHPKVHGGLLGIRTNHEHSRLMKEHDIKNIDMLVINLYPFKETISKPDVTFEDAIENIDIGGPAMLRAASKNFEFVTVLIDPADYEPVVGEMKRNGGAVSRETNLKLAAKVFRAVSEYDRMIADYLDSRQD